MLPSNIRDSFPLHDNDFMLPDLDGLIAANLELSSSNMMLYSPNEKQYSLEDCENDNGDKLLNILEQLSSRLHLVTNLLQYIEYKITWGQYDIIDSFNLVLQYIPEMTETIQDVANFLSEVNFYCVLHSHQLVLIEKLLHNIASNGDLLKAWIAQLPQGPLANLFHVEDTLNVFSSNLSTVIASLSSGFNPQYGSFNMKYRRDADDLVSTPTDNIVSTGSRNTSDIDSSASSSYTLSPDSNKSDGLTYSNFDVSNGLDYSSMDYYDQIVNQTISAKLDELISPLGSYALGNVDVNNESGDIWGVFNSPKNSDNDEDEQPEKPARYTAFYSQNATSCTSSYRSAAKITDAFTLFLAPNLPDIRSIPTLRQNRMQAWGFGNFISYSFSIPTHPTYTHAENCFEPYLDYNFNITEKDILIPTMALSIL